ncbi:MAG: hypothetical protein ACYDA6_09305, partial [Solirubrobacteraceae bacterium]
MDFNISRLRRADWFLGGGALALFIFMFFFHWFGYSYSGAGFGGASINVSGGADAWNSLSNTRWILLLTLIAAVG